MTAFDRHLLQLLNHAVGSSALLFEICLILCGKLPLIAAVTTMLALWWKDPEGVDPHAPILGAGSTPSRTGLLQSRRRCVAVGVAAAAAFVTTRLFAFSTTVARPLAAENLLVPVDAERWNSVVTAMTGFGAFPSDHAALFTAVGVGLTAWGLVPGAIAILLAVVFMTARVAVGFHYPSDMVVGALIGAVWAGLLLYWMRRSPRLLDEIVRLFDRAPSVMYPILFLAAMDFVSHFRLILRTVFYIVLTLLGTDKPV